MSISNDFRATFVNYFIKNNHQHLKSSSLIPQGDDTLLFTNAGMVQFKNIFMGLKKAPFPRAVTIQKCLRAGGKHNDLDNVGYTPRHHTFFEMLGNFSFGDYFKEEAIWYAWNFLITELGFNKDKLIVTVHDEDNEAFTLWQKIAGLPTFRILKIKGGDNFWEMADTGPCGYCSEIFYDLGDTLQGGLPGSESEGSRYLEVWNIVFMQFERLVDGTLIKLKQPCIDTGMGLERVLSVIQGVSSNYEIDLFKKLITNISDILQVKITSQNQHAFNVLADHIRSSAFLIVEGVLPSNEGRGYVLRRIIRRAVRYLYLLGIQESAFYQLINPLKYEMGSYYKELITFEQLIAETIKAEENKFSTMFGNGLKILHDEIDNTSNKILSGKFAFKLYDTYGFPLDLTKDVLKSQKIKVNEKEFDEAFAKHKLLAKESWKGNSNIAEEIWYQVAKTINPSTKISNDLLTNSAVLEAIVVAKTNEMSKTLVAKAEEEQLCYLLFNKTPFYYEKGGQIADRGFISGNKDCVVKVIDVQQKADNLIVHKCLLIQGKLEVGSEFILEVDKSLRAMTAANHTTAHLLHSALRLYVGNHVQQKGSFLTDQRLRFDFFHQKPLTAEEIHLVEVAINKIILQNVAVTVVDMPLETAMQQNAIALFGEKYPKIVTTVKIGNQSDNLYSFELCGGTHVTSTGKIGSFKIIAESSIASGVRRIEAITGITAEKYFEQLYIKAKSLSNLLHSDIFSIEDKVKTLLDNNTQLTKKYLLLQNKYYDILLKSHISTLNPVNTLCLQVQAMEMKNIRNIINNFTESANTLILLYIILDNKASFLLSIPKKYSNFISKQVTAQFLTMLEAKGGGNTIIQGKGNPKKITEAFAYIVAIIKQTTHK